MHTPFPLSPASAPTTAETLHARIEGVFDFLSRLERENTAAVKALMDCIRLPEGNRIRIDLIEQSVNNVYSSLDPEKDLHYSKLKGNISLELTRPDGDTYDINLEYEKFTSDLKPRWHIVAVSQDNREMQTLAEVVTDESGPDEDSPLVTNPLAREFCEALADAYEAYLPRFCDTIRRIVDGTDAILEG